MLSVSRCSLAQQRHAVCAGEWPSAALLCTLFACISCALPHLNPPAAHLHLSPYPFTSFHNSHTCAHIRKHALHAPASLFPAHRLLYSHPFPFFPAGRTLAPALQHKTQQLRCPPAAVWTRPTPDRDEDFTRPSYIPQPGGSPVIQPYRRDDQPLYTPSTPEFKPAELPEQQKEMPKGPTMPGEDAYACIQHVRCMK
jgi:hypothetical protein